MRLLAIPLMFLAVSCEPSPSEYLDRCMSTSQTLSDIDKITSDVSKVLTEVGITHWLDSGTLLGSYRFSAPLPFDDDSDLGLMRDDYIKHREKLPAALTKLGYKLVNWNLDPHSDTIPQVFFQDDDTRPHLDFFLFEPLEGRADYLRLSSDTWHQVAKHAKDEGLGFPTRSIFDGEGKLAKLKFVDQEYFAPVDLTAYFKRWYPEPNILYSFMMSQNHGTDKLCGKNVAIKDIRKKRALLDKMFAHLEEVFGSRYKRSDSRLY